MAGLVLLSGGQDSSTCLAIASAAEDEVSAVSVFYGQRHRKELECARYQAGFFGVKNHWIINLDDIPLNSPLVNDVDSDSKNIPEDWSSEKGPAPTIVPGRNAMLLSIACSIAESNGISRVYCGVSSMDYSGYPDCRPDFIEALQKAIYLSSRGQVQIITPLLHKTKAEMIMYGTALKVDWKRTWTCYRGGEDACGKCPACKLRLQAFKSAGMTDPIDYDYEERDED